MGVSKKLTQKLRSKSLAQGRPPLIKNHAPSLSSKATRAVIRKHHNLLKAHAKALETGDTALADQISKQLTEDDLKNYQQASKTGQGAERGGDSSKVLVDWLEEETNEQNARPYKVLEVGALSTTNVISRLTTKYEVTRIDLHSQGKGIVQQDFMERPLPSSHDSGNVERFDIISLSLVLNFVGDPVRRGEMLRRCTEFLLPPPSEQKRMVPCLFLVLPAPCVTNSRYLTELRLEEIMSTIGFILLKKRITAKLYYSLFRYDPSSVSGTPKPVFKKKELVSGRSRNNFAIVMH